VVSIGRGAAIRLGAASAAGVDHPVHSGSLAVTTHPGRSHATPLDPQPLLWACWRDPDELTLLLPPLLLVVPQPLLAGCSLCHAAERARLSRSRLHR
jgi:hypothetical protein